MPTRKAMLGALLVERGFLSSTALSEALDQQGRTGEDLGSMLVRAGLITEPQLLETLA